REGEAPSEPSADPARREARPLESLSRGSVRLALPNPSRAVLLERLTIAWRAPEMGRGLPLIRPSGTFSPTGEGDGDRFGPGARPSRSVERSPSPRDGGERGGVRRLARAPSNRSAL